METKVEKQPPEVEVLFGDEKNESLTGSFQIENALKAAENTEHFCSTDRGSVYSDTPLTIS